MAGNTSYPGALDTTTNLPIASALVSVELDGDGDSNKIHSNLHGVLSEAAVAIEAKIATMQVVILLLFQRGMTDKF